MLPAPKTGRNSIKGCSQKKKEHSRQCFRVDLKQDALDYLKECGSLKQTVLHFSKTQFRPTAPSRKDVISWRNEAWTALSKETIINGFVKAHWMQDPRPSSSVNQLVEQLLGLTVSTDLSTAMANEEVLQDEEEQTQSLEEGIEDDDEENVSEDEEEDNA